MKNTYFLFSKVAADVLAAIKKECTSVSISVDVNQSKAEFAIKDNSLILDDVNTVSFDDLRYIKKHERKLFEYTDNVLSPVEYRGEHYYKLVPTPDYAPTVEISGVQMHRTKDYDPFIDAKQKVQEVIAPGFNVLDTCSGLGYTAIWSMRLGASSVMSLERDEYILKIRQHNPWSKELNNENITVVHTDAVAYVKTLEANQFDAVIHDPPRFSLSGEMYSKDFYQDLHRVLRKNGRLFHYTGTPYSKRKGNSFQDNTMKRLVSVGFTKQQAKPETLGLSVIKR